MPHSRHASVRRAAPRGRFDAVLFDLDGVLVDTEPWWNGVRIEFARAHGRSWGEGDQRAVMGGNSRQWAATMRNRLHLPGLTLDEIQDAVVGGMVARYRSDPPPAIDGALNAVRRIAGVRPVALASSGHRDVIDAALDATGLRGVFGAIVSSDEVEHGKPAPDVYLLAALRLGVSAERCLVVEDSLNGVLAGKAAGMFVVLVPIDSVPPPPETRLIADLVIGRLADLDPDAIAFDPDAIARAPGSPAH
jgi:beta-phosphoglucomutase-like phosphatase (HAD superfamily)